MRQKLSFLALSLALIVVFASPIHAQTDETAAVLTIVYRGVRVQRANTAQWIALPQGAVMPLSAGDRLDTGLYGRALVQFGDEATALVMPQTTFHLVDYRHDGNHFASITLEADGLLVQQTAPERIAAYDLVSDTLHLTDTAPLFAVWSSQDTPDTVIVADGELRLSDSLTLEARTGYRTNYEAVTSLDLPLNEARLIAAVEGCPGVIDTTDNERLLVRAGSAIDSLSIGAIPDETPVLILAISSNGLRMRIQHLSDFGWVETLAIETDCADLPVLPVGYTEFFRTIYDVTPQEVPLLAPFYGQPDDDPWFYRYTVSSQP